MEVMTEVIMEMMVVMAAATFDAIATIYDP